MSHLYIQWDHPYQNNVEVLLTRTDLPETVIDVPFEEFITQQFEDQYEHKFEDEFEDESEDESKYESLDEPEYESEEF